MRAIRRDQRPKLIECLDRRTARIGLRFQHQGRNGADKHGFGHALRPVAGDIAGDLAAASRMADMDGVFQIERFRQRREIVRVGVQVVAGPGLTRPAMPAPVMGDAAVAAAGEEEHLIFEGVRRKRPAMAEHDGLSGAPVLVINLGSVLRLDRGHVGFPCCKWDANTQGEVVCSRTGRTIM